MDAPIRRGELNPSHIVRYIEQHCASVTLPQVAARFACHPNSVTRLLNRTLGASFQDIVARARAQRACDLLAQGQTVQQVAGACGYTSLSHFYDAFGRQQGMTPGAYRRQARAGRRRDTTKTGHD